MAKRSVQVTIVNNTPFTLTEFYECIPHGSWGPVTVSPTSSPTTPGDPGWTLPGTIKPGELVTLSCADAEFGIATGTEAWAFYQVITSPGTSSVPPSADLLYLHLDNPYIWGDSTQPIIAHTTLANPPGSPAPSWPPWGGTVADASLQTQSFIVTAASNTGFQPLNFGNTGAEVWDWAVAAPYLFLLGLIDAEEDINLSFAVGLRQLGSVGESIAHFHDGHLGLRMLAQANHQSSLRALFSL